MYNGDYFNLMLNLNSSTAEKISAIRWDFVARVNAKTVLDFGSGVGFFAAFAPDGVKVDTLDINPQANTTGIRQVSYDLLTMWDVFEHLPLQDIHTISGMTRVCRYVALSLPVLPKGKNLLTWKHLKPGEHLYQFTPQSLEDIFTDWGFAKVKEGHPENEIREDIYSALYENIKT